MRFGCRFCGRWFTNPHTYGGHLNHHKGDKDPSITCECGKKFDSVIKYRSHIGRCNVMEAKRAVAIVEKTTETHEKATKAHEKAMASLLKKVKKAAKPKDTKEYIMFWDGEIRAIGSMKEIENELRIIADMNELPDEENQVKIYEVARQLKVEYDRQIKVNLK